MTSLSVTSFDAALKQLYAVKRVQDLTYTMNPLLAMMPKFENFGGRNLPLVNTVSQPQGVSSDFPVAQQARNSANLQDFLLTRVRKYSIASVTGEAALASKNDAFAFLSGVSVQMDGAMKALARSLATDLPRNGGGSVAAIGTAPAGNTTITLTDINDVVGFEIGMQLEADTTNGTAGGTPKPGFVTVVAVNRTLGQVTVDQNWDVGIPTVALNDFIFRRGDFGVVMAGLEAWIPAVAPAPGALFFGVDRFVDTRLYGQRFDGTGLTIQEALVGGQSVAAREGAKISHCFINNVQFRNLVNELGAKVVYDRATAFNAAHIGFRTIVIDGDAGPIQVIADNTIQSDTAWMLQMDTWKLCTLGPATRLLTLDNNRILRETNADAYEGRVGMYGNVGCTGPGFNCRVTLS